MEIRAETKNDIENIRTLTEKAFAPMPFSNGKEPDIIEVLRAYDQLTLSLVAVSKTEILGHITFSPITIDGIHDHWFGLGPVSVHPDKQRQGIGSALILEGLSLIKKTGAKGCALVGNPNYYSRFGFKNKTGLTYRNVDTSFVQKITFVQPDRNGELLFSPAFENAATG